MGNRLFIFGRFAHDTQRILAAIGQLALVGIECGLDGLLGFAPELGIASFAYAEHGRGLVHDPQLALWHDPSLAHAGEGAEPL
jgi:hypothetical protein